MLYEGVYGRRAGLVLVGLLGLVTLLADLCTAQTGSDPRLIQKVKLSGEATPLDELLQSLCAKPKLKLDLNEARLKEEGIDPKTPIQLGDPLDGVTLGSALTLLLEPHGLDYSVEKGVLKVLATPDQEALFRVSYPLTGLEQIESATLILALETMSAGLWDSIDGIGGKVVDVGPRGITIEQTRGTHRDLADLLIRIQAAMTGKRPTSSISERSEDLLRKALARPVAFPDETVTLKQLPEQLRSVLKINVLLARHRLEDEGIKLDTKVTLSSKKQPAIQTLAEALAPLKLTTAVRQEVLSITTQAAENETLLVRIYSPRGGNNRSPLELAEQLTQNKELGPWEDTDGEGGAVAVVGPLLLIRQSATVHEQLTRLIGPGL